MFLPKWFCDFYFYVGPVSSPKVMVELTPRLVRGFIGVNPMVGNAIEGNAGREFGVFLQRALVFEVEVAAVIDGVGAWVAEQCIERCCRYLLLTGRARRFQCEMAEAEQTVSDNERTLRFQVVQLFINVQLAKSVLQLAKDDLANFSEEVELGRARVAAGDLAEGDYLKLSLQKLQFEQDVSSAQLALVQARTNLRQQLG